jgi:hypothetical protein
MFSGIQEERFGRLTAQEERWLDNVREPSMTAISFISSSPYGMPRTIAGPSQRVRRTGRNCHMRMRC